MSKVKSKKTTKIEPFDALDPCRDEKVLFDVARRAAAQSSVVQLTEPALDLGQHLLDGYGAVYERMTGKKPYGADVEDGLLEMRDRCATAGYLYGLAVGLLLGKGGA